MLKTMEVPNSQIKDHASHFEAARRELVSGLPRGIFWATTNVAIISIELHLKSLCADDQFDPIDDEVGMARVIARPKHPNHSLTGQLEKMPDSVESQLQSAFAAADFAKGKDLTTVLKSFDGVFLWSRYAFSLPARDDFDYPLLMKLSEFLSSFVNKMDTTLFFRSE